jgi:hypothetical protein
MAPAAKQRAHTDREESSLFHHASGTNKSIIIKVLISTVALVCGYLAGASQSRLQPTSAASTGAITLQNTSPATLKFLTPIKSRYELALLLQEEGFEVGAELGVQRGHFASETLQRWSECKRFYLVDIWAPQDNYKVLIPVVCKCLQRCMLVQPRRAKCRNSSCFSETVGCQQPAYW